jgi:hypothetical protein
MQGAPQQSPAMQNMQGRAALLQTGIQMSQIVQQAYALTVGGVQQRIDLLRVGVTVGVQLDFTLSLNISGAMTASPAGPWPAIQQIKYTDFSGIDRVNTDALGLFLLDTFKHNWLANNAVAGDIPAIGVINTNILTQPTGTGATQVCYFSVYVPMAYDASSDLRGAVPSMTNIGQHYLTVTPCAALTSATDVLAAPYTAGTATVNSFTMDVTQFYIQPQSLSPAMLPGIDLTTIYEINGRNVTTAGFTSNTALLINYPNDRAVMAAYHVFEDSSSLPVNETDMAKIELLVNSNTVVRQVTPRLFRAGMRKMARGDVPPSIYYWAHRRQPILTNLYATVQARYTLGTLATGGTITKLVAQYESFYPSGQPLAGITTNAG